MNLEPKFDTGISQVYSVNNHLHTPYSFSAFDSIEQIFQLARDENIRSLGINDFFTGDGYREFNSFAEKYRIYPVFNIEFIGLSKEFRDQSIRINDPNNPGRIYLSGKGLKYPFTLSQKNMKILKSVQEESQAQIREMIKKSNQFFQQVGVNISLKYDEIKNLFAKNLVRERHLAKAVYHFVITNSKGNLAEVNEVFKLIYSGAVPVSDPADISSTENEIRSRLFKSGGPAFVPEDESAFLTVSRIIEIVLDAGGIPCYPVLLDDTKGNFTDFEKNWEAMYQYFKKMNIACLELIPNRNKMDVIQDFVGFFRDKNFIIALGTEHNTPEMIPLTPFCRNNLPLTEKLRFTSFEAACVFAGHQHFLATGQPGFIDEAGKPKSSEIEYFFKQGRIVIDNYLTKA